MTATGNPKTFGNNGQCPACRACKHPHMFRTSDEPDIYRCSDCVYATRNKPLQETWYLNGKGKWQPDNEAAEAAAAVEQTKQ